MVTATNLNLKLQIDKKNKKNNNFFVYFLGQKESAWLFI